MGHLFDRTWISLEKDIQRGETFRVSRPEELPLKPLSEPYVRLSPHTAPNHPIEK